MWGCSLTQAQAWHVLGLERSRDRRSILARERRTSKAPRWGGVGREMREGTRIHAGSTGFFRLSHHAWRAEEPQLILSLPRRLRRDYRVGFVDGFLTPWCNGVAVAAEPRSPGEGVPHAAGTGSGRRHCVPPLIIFTAVLVFTAGDRTYPSCKMPLSEEPGNVLGGETGGIKKAQVKVKSTRHLLTIARSQSLTPIPST